MGRLFSSRHFESDVPFDSPVEDVPEASIHSFKYYLGGSYNNADER